MFTSCWYRLPRGAPVLQLTSPWWRKVTLKVDYIKAKLNLKAEREWLKLCEFSNDNDTLHFNFELNEQAATDGKP